MTTFEKLAKRIKEDTGVTCTEFERTRVGYYQKAHGAFLWTARAVGDDGSSREVGSTYSATELLKSKGALVFERPREISPS